MKDGAVDGRTPVPTGEPLPMPAAKMEPAGRAPAGPATAGVGTDPAERDWQRIFDAASDAIWLTDRDFRITRANRASARILGKPLDEIVGSTCAQAICGTNRPPEDCPLAQAHRTKGHARGEMYIPAPGVWVEMSADPVLDEKGNVTGILHVATDITDRKKTQEAVRESEERFKDLFENAREAVVLIDLGGTITGTNRLVEDYGFQRKELIGKGLFDLVAEDHRTRALADFKVLLGGKPMKGEMDVVTPRGVISVEYRDNPILRGGQVVGVQAILTDVTKRKHAEQQLRAERDRVQKYLDIAGVMLVVIDAEERVGLINKRGCEILGYTEDEMLGKNWFDNFLPSRTREHSRAVLAGLTADRIHPNEHVENLVLTRTGQERLLAWHNTVLTDETGQIIGTLGSGEDITDRKHADELMRTLATAALELVELPPEADLFQFIAEKVLALIGAGIVSVNSIEGDTLTVRQITGAKTVTLTLAQRLLGKAVIGMPLQGLHEEARTLLMTGKLTKVEGGFYELFFHTVPRPVCWTLEKAIGLTECCSIGLRRPDRLLGSVTILSQKATELNRGVIEAFVNQASIALERRKVEEELRESEDKFRHMFDYSVVGKSITLPNGKVQANQALAQMLGYPPKEFAGRTWQEVTHPEDVEATQRAIDSLLSGAQDAARLTKRYLHKNGSIVWADASTSLRRDKEGRPLYFMTTVSDITERKRAEEELRRSERRETILNRIANVFLTVSDDQMYAEVLAIVLETMGSEFGVFGFIADNGDLIVPSITREVSQECQVSDRSMVFPAATWGDSLWGRAIREQKVFCSNGPLHTPPGHIPIDNFLTTPIVFAGKTIGLISMANRAQGYTEADKDLLKSIADCLSPVLNARLERDRQEQERQEAERKLRESETKYRELFENAREAIVIFNMDKIVTDANRFVEEYGFRTTDLIGRNYLDFVAEPYWEKAIEDFELLRRGMPLEGEFEVLTPKGRITVYYKDCPIVRGGRVVGVQSILMDLTKRKQAEEALRESETRYRLLANHASDVISTTDLNLQLTYCSPSVERMLGYTAEEMLTKRAEETLMPASRELIEKIFAEEMELERTGQGDPLRSRVVEVEEVRKDGTTLWVEVRAGFMRDANGAAVGIVGVTRDITERRRAEESLKLFRALIDQSNDTIEVVDPTTGRFLDVNETGCVAHGYSRAEYLSLKVFDIDPTTNPVVFAQVMARLWESGSATWDGVHRRKDGTTFPVEVNLKHARLDQDYVVTVVREITDRKKVEQQLRDYQNRLRELAAELTLAEEKERRRIAVGVHDQIGQRLALAKLTLQSLQASTGEADTSRIMEGVCKDIDKVVEHTHSLTFELSNPILYEVGFEPAVESWLLQQVQDRHGIECIFEADEPRMELDKETRVVLFDIVRELLTNVVTHAKAKQVDVRIRRLDGAAQVSVSDDGIGFQPPGSGAHVSESGGFGLFNIREKLDYLGGSITIDSAPGEGTCIVVVVPLTYPRNSGK